MMKFIVLIITFSISAQAKFFVAVMDTGIDLINFPYTNRLELNIKGQKGIYKTIQDFQDPGHGTHVSGIILERTSDQITIVPMKMGDYSSARVKKIDDVKSRQRPVYSKLIDLTIKQKIKLVNISSGTNNYRIKDYNAFKKAKNTLFIVSAGNEVFEDDGKQDLDAYRIFEYVTGDRRNKFKYNYYPCAYELPNIICVGSAKIEEDGNVKVYSNYGSMFVDVFANGEDVVSTVVGGTREFMSGSSMATPKVTAVFAEEWSKNPKMSMSKLKEVVFKKFESKESLKSNSKLGLILPD